MFLYLLIVSNQIMNGQNLKQLVAAKCCRVVTSVRALNVGF